MHTTPPILRPLKVVSETKRDGDVFRLYGAAFHDIAHLDHMSALGHHVPVAAKDITLVAFAQLAAIRLGATRAIISLIDAQHQHVLAEATPATPLRGGARLDLWLGNVSFPREILVCEQVLGIDLARITASEEAAVVIDDLAQSEYAGRPYVQAGIMRFYAGVALTSPRGAIVGALSIIDSRPRAGMPREDILYLQDLAATIMEHLNTYTLKVQQSRGEQLTRGLISFAQGASMLQPDYHDHLPLSPDKPVDSTPDAPSSKPGAGTAMRILQESILPANSKAMFARAANIMRASSDLDGVLILDASLASEHRKPGNSTASSYDEGEGAHSSPNNSGQRCQILGFSTRETSSVAENLWALRNRSLLEADLTRMLSLFPLGNILHFTADGEVVSSNDSESATWPVLRQQRGPSEDRSQKVLSAIQATLPGARSVAFVPFWDFERSRWFAGCLCWTKEPDRLLSPKLDLLFFKVFGHSIMNELSRLDTIASNQVKATFVSLISHELRSPLHGILGSIHFLQDSPLDSFQVTMLNSMAACGNTLLDTMDHVLDYSKFNEPSRNVSSKSLKGTETVCVSSKPLKTLRSNTSAAQLPGVDLGLATEEVVEAVFAAKSYQATPDMLDDGTLSPLESRSNDPDSMFPSISAKRRSCFIILDIEERDWSFSFPIGAWRRILMNIFGNALKFTQYGHIKVSLRENRSKRTEKSTHIIVTVIDTGQGMSPEFLANKLFQPFSQENPLHSGGVGLGLTIVRQIIDEIGGKVEVTSNISKGTLVTVKFVVPGLETPYLDSPQRAVYLAARSRLYGRKICILHHRYPETPDGIITHTASELFAAALGTTLAKSLNMEVIHTTEWVGHNADIVICSEPSFDYLAATRNSRNRSARTPATIFVVADGLEAAMLRSDARILSKQSVVEIIAQPCGPYKLANILSNCLNRYEAVDQNIQHQPLVPSYLSPRTDPQASPITPSQLESTKPSCTDAGEPQPNIVLQPVSICPPISFLPPDTLTSLPPTEPNGPQPSTKSLDSITPYPLENVLEVSYVLIADDNPINRRLLVAFLNKRKIRYQEAENGLEAVTAYQEGSEHFDIIFMDISMPIMDGTTATRLIRDHEARYHIKPTHIIALTGLTSASARLTAWNSGVNCYMTKPVDFRKLGRMLHSKNGL